MSLHSLSLHLVKFLMSTIVLSLLLSPALKTGFEIEIYYLTIALSLLIVPFAFYTDFKLEFILFILIILISVMLNLFKLNTIPTGFYEMFFIIVIQPIVAYIACYLNNNETYYINLVSKLTILSFIGSIYFYLAILGLVPDFNGIFLPEFTMISGESLVIRNTSIYTNSLVASGIGLLHLTSSAFMYYKTRKFIYLFLFIAALFVVFSCLSRRGFIPAFMVCFALYNIFTSKGKLSLILISFAFIGISFIYLNSYLSLMFERLASVFDFGGSDASNISRLYLIREGLLISLMNPLGTGLGTLSSVGKSVETLANSVAFISVTESFYVGIIGELGIIFIIPLLILIIKYGYEISREYRIYFLFPFMIESIMGLSLLNPAISFIFMIVLFSYITNHKKNNSLFRTNSPTLN